MILRNALEVAFRVNMFAGDQIERDIVLLFFFIIDDAIDKNQRIAPGDGIVKFFDEETHGG